MARSFQFSFFLNKPFGSQTMATESPPEMGVWGWKSSNSMGDGSLPRLMTAFSQYPPWKLHETIIKSHETTSLPYFTPKKHRFYRWSPTLDGAALGTGGHGSAGQVTPNGGFVLGAGISEACLARNVGTVFTMKIYEELLKNAGFGWVLMGLN